MRKNNLKGSSNCPRILSHYHCSRLSFPSLQAASGSLVPTRPLPPLPFCAVQLQEEKTLRRIADTEVRAKEVLELKKQHTAATSQLAAQEEDE